MSQHNFNKGEVEELRNKLNPWDGNTYKLGNKTALILDNYFKTPSEFNEMIDLDKTEEK